MENTKLDRKGIYAYLAIAYAITYGIEWALIASGFRITHLQYPI